MRRDGTPPPERRVAPAGGGTAYPLVRMATNADLPAVARMRTRWSGAEPGADPGFEQRLADWWHPDWRHPDWRRRAEIPVAPPRSQRHRMAKRFILCLRDLGRRAARTGLRPPGHRHRLGPTLPGSAARVVWLALAADDAVGMVNLAVFQRMPRPSAPVSRWGYLANLWVEPEYRRQGIGLALVDEVLRWSRQQSLERVVLNPSEASVSLYRARGFRPAGDLLRLDLDPEPEQDL